MPKTSALATQLKKSGTWKLLLPKLGFPVESLSGRLEKCPLCGAGDSFKFRAYDSACWGGCSKCKVSGNGWALLSAKTGIPQGGKALGRLIASKLGLFNYDPDPDGPRYEHRSRTRRNNFKG